jgi:Flp pilus assembly protein TadG
MKRLRHFLHRSDGTSTIEFTLIFPAFIIILLASVESGIMMIRNVMLERGVDIAVRELRLGKNVPKDEDELKKLVCNSAAFIKDCTSVLRLELVRVDTATFDMPTAAATCVQRDKLTQPALTYTSGVDHDLMLLRACAVFNPYFPTTGLGLRLPKDGTGLYALTAASAFVVEPT